MLNWTVGAVKSQTLRSAAISDYDPGAIFVHERDQNVIFIYVGARQFLRARVGSTDDIIGIDLDWEDDADAYEDVDVKYSGKSASISIPPL